MDNLVCTDCGTTYYSAAARLMVERGERCDCGARLRLRDGAERAVVGVAAEGGGNGSPEADRRSGGRRFAR